MIDKDIGNGECESCLHKFSNVRQKEEKEFEFKASSKKWFLAPPPLKSKWCLPNMIS